MTTVTMSEARAKLSDWANEVAFEGKRICVERNRKPAFVMVAMEDFQLLEKLERILDVKISENALKKGKFISWDEAQKVL